MTVTMANPSLSIVRDVACTVCGCVCDDLTVTIASGRIAAITPDCPLAKPHFLGRGGETGPTAWLDGEPAETETAIARAVEILRAAKLPLIYGLSRSSTEGQRAAVALADRLGGVIDTTASGCHAPSILALQQVGESVATLGESASRCDLVIFWGSNPVVTHPRHLDRYGMPDRPLFPPREPVDGDGSDPTRHGRHLVTVDIHPTATTERADTAIFLPPQSDFEALLVLRTFVAARLPGAKEAVKRAAARLMFPPADAPANPLPIAALADLAERMTTCRSGIVFFGLGLIRQGVPHANVEQLLRLVTELNAVARFYARRMRVPGDVAGADNVLCWQTGYPFSVDLRKGFPRYGPGEFSAEAMLSRREPDAVVLIGADSVETLSPTARAVLAELPVIVLDAAGLGEATVEPNLLAGTSLPGRSVPEPLPRPAVRFRTAVYGLHRAGTAYRMDEVPIPLRAVVASDSPSDGEILQAIANGIGVNLGHGA